MVYRFMFYYAWLTCKEAAFLYFYPVAGGHKKGQVFKFYTETVSFFSRSELSPTGAAECETLESGCSGR